MPLNNQGKTKIREKKGVLNIDCLRSLSSRYSLYLVMLNLVPQNQTDIKVIWKRNNSCYRCNNLRLIITVKPRINGPAEKKQNHLLL